jgi:hypothetical protein
MGPPLRPGPAQGVPAMPQSPPTVREIGMGIITQSSNVCGQVSLLMRKRSAALDDFAGAFGRAAQAYRSDPEVLEYLRRVYEEFDRRGKKTLAALEAIFAEEHALEEIAQMCLSPESLGLPSPSQSAPLPRARVPQVDPRAAIDPRMAVDPRMARQGARPAPGARAAAPRPSTVPTFDAYRKATENRTRAQAHAQAAAVPNVAEASAPAPTPTPAAKNGAGGNPANKDAEGTTSISSGANDSTDHA